MKAQWTNKIAGVLALRMKYQSILKSLFLIVVCLCCVDCGGDNKHEKEALLEDEYGYTGSWIGQISDNEFVILNIMRSDEKIELPTA